MFVFLSICTLAIVILSEVEGSHRMVTTADAHEIPRLRSAALGMTIRKNALVEIRTIEGTTKTTYANR